LQIRRRGVCTAWCSKMFNGLHILGVGRRRKLLAEMVANS